MPNVGKRILAVAGAAILATSLIGQSMAQDKPPIKIGLILPYTGFASFLIPYFETGFILGIEDVNAAGGINGSMLELQKEDTQFNPAEAIRVYRRLVRADALATFGPISSTVWENLTPLTEREKMPIINTTAQKPQISNSRYTLRMTSHDLKMMPEGVEQFVQLKPNVKRIVIMGDVKEQATKTALDSYDREARKQGLEILDTISFTTRTTEFSPIVIKLRGLQPDAVFVSSLVPAVVALAREMDAQGMDIPILNNLIFWPAGGVNVIAPLGKEVYSMGFSTNQPIDNEAHNRYVARYAATLADNSKVPKPANTANSTIAYEAIQLVAQIMRDAGIDGNTDVKEAREMIADGLGNTKKWDGTLLKFTFDDDRNAYIPAHLLKVNNETKEWNYALPGIAR
jgi:ABC-type branched-subunit amino acid transport system substrate-binding protein